MPFPHSPVSYLRTFLVALALSGCSDGSDSPSPPLCSQLQYQTSPTLHRWAVPNLLSTTFPLEDLGYQQREFFLTGVASAFSNTNELSSDGLWEVAPSETADYRTRVLIYAPIDRSTFSGSVYVEWLNVTTGFELPVSYGTAHTELLREGHAIALFSAQFAGVEGSENGLLPLYLKAVNPERYGSLNHPGDSFSYDMFTQIAGLLRNGDSNELLGGASANLVFAMGQSQSASRLVSYYNAIQPLYNAYDGYLIQNRGSGSSSIAQEPLAPISTPTTVFLRNDINTVAINVQGESDVHGRGMDSSRQPDSDQFRLWEVAGSAHNDEYTFVSGRNDSGQDPRYAVVVEETSILGFQQCELPMNSGYLVWPVNAAVHALNKWAAVAMRQQVLTDWILTKMA